MSNPSPASKERRKPFRPALFVGLGGYGCAIGRRIVDTIREANPGAAEVVAFVEIRDDGTVAAEGGGDADTMSLRLPFDGASTYAARFEAIASQEQPLARSFVRILDHLHQRRLLQILEDRGTFVEPRTSVYFVAPLCDDVGSAALIACIEIFNRLVATRLVGQELHRTVLGFFPDLFPDFRDADERYARAYVCLQELEFVAAQTELTSPFEFVYLFTAKNEENQDIGSHEDLATALGETLSLILRREIAKDVSFGSVLVNRDDYGAITRYSSLGTSKLIFPRQEICCALDGHFAASVLQDIGVPNYVPLDRQIVSSDVREFIRATNLLGVETQLETTADGRQIWTKFNTTLGKNAVSMRVEDILAQLSADCDEYEKEEITRITREIRQRQGHLAATHGANMKALIDTRIDKSLIGAEAFLDVFLNVHGKATTGDVIDAGLTIDDVDQKAKKFFDDLLGINRKQLITLQQEILSKEMALEQHEAELKARESIAAAEPAKDDAPDAKALDNVIETTTKELKEKKQASAQLQQAVATHDRQMKDGSYRRALLQRQRDKAEEEAAGLTDELEKSDQDWRVNRAALAEEKRRGRAAIVKAAAYSFGAVALYAALAYFLLYKKFAIDAHRLRQIGGWAFVIAIIVIIAVGIWTWMRLESAKARLFTAESRKQTAIRSIVRKHEEAFKTVFDFGVHGASIDWAAAFRESVTRLQDDVREFHRALNALHSEEKKAYDDVAFPQTLFRRSVLAPTEVPHFLESADRYDLERKRFPAANPISAVFGNFRPTRTLDTLITPLRIASAEVFTAVQQLTIEQLLIDRERDGWLNIDEKLQQLLRFGAPMVQLRVERGDDHAQLVRYLGTATGSAARLAESARRIGQEAQQYRSDVETDITLVTIKVGFPAHHVALIVHSDFVMDQQKDVRGLQVVGDWKLEPLMPSALMLGDENDAARRLACESLALGIMEETPQGLVVDGTVIGPSYRSVIEVLRSLRGAGLKSKLQIRTAELFAKSGAVERLTEFLSKGGADTIDQRIIQTALDRLDTSV